MGASYTRAHLHGLHRADGGSPPRGCRLEGAVQLVRVIDTWGVRRYLTFMKTTISSKGQIVLPAELRRVDEIRPGDQFEVERLDEGEYVLRRVAARPNRGLVALLRSCPEDDWFVPGDRKVTTDDIAVADFR